jgi:hypothetical protein
MIDTLALIARIEADLSMLKAALAGDGKREDAPHQPPDEELIDTWTADQPIDSVRWAAREKAREYYAENG